MVIPLLIAGLGVLALPGVLHDLGQRVRPAQWATTVLAALLIGTVAVESAVVLFACDPRLRPSAARGPLLGGAATVIALLIPILTGVSMVRGRRALQACRIEPWVSHHLCHQGYDVVVLPAQEPLAVAVGGFPAQILISQGLLQLLPAPEVCAVLRHEAAHLKHQHHRYLLFVAALEAVLGRVFHPLTASARSLRLALERWADEAAATDPGGSPLEVKAALLNMARAAESSRLAAFSAANTLTSRLEALDRPSSSPYLQGRLVAYAPAAALVVAVLLTAQLWASQGMTTVAVALRCLT